MVNIAPRHVWTPHPNLMVAFVGLEGDVQSLSQELQIQVSSKLGRALGFSLTDELKERRISPRALASITSHVLYQYRGGYYVEPLVVGLNPDTYQPFLCAMDMIGAQSFSKEFVCSGAASKSLYGTAEALWRPDMDEEELVQTCGKAFQSALERDCLSGYGSLVYLISKGGIIEYDLVNRND
jgi:20S proteasome subunit beta 3